jgi:superfamily I DNA/RNA helicase
MQVFSYEQLNIMNLSLFKEDALMNHNKDYDRDHDREDTLTNDSLRDFLEASKKQENELMRQYVMTAERIHNNEELKDRLQNFAQGNAKRTSQLEDELNQLKNNQAEV